MALTKAEIAEQLYEEVGLNKREAKEFVEVFFWADIRNFNIRFRCKDFRIWEFCFKRQEGKTW